MAILLTGGAGYIGSNTAALLLQKGIDVLIYDNFVNSSSDRTHKLEEFSQQDGGRGKLWCVNGDICATQTLSATLKQYNIEEIIHFAALKSVSESQKFPQEYHHTNVTGTDSVIRAAQEARVKRIVFSSSAAVYGKDLIPPFKESDSTIPLSNYGQTKLLGESLLQSVADDPKTDLRGLALRYFNPAGARSDGKFSEPIEGTGNIFPALLKSAVTRTTFQVFGDDYPTADGTAIRDYVHILDIAEGHICALEAMRNQESELPFVINLGSGTGSSVQQVLDTFQKVNNITLQIDFKPRREGDIASSYADNKLAGEALGWRPLRGLNDICLSAWSAYNK